MIVASILMVAILIFYIKVRKEEYATYKPSSKIWIPFYQMSSYIVEAIFRQKKGYLKQNVLKSQVIDRLKQINPTDRSSLHIKKFYVEKIALVILIILVGSMLTILANIGQGSKSDLIEERMVERKTYGQGTTHKEFKASIEEEKEEQDISITISEQSLTKQEVTEMFAKAKSELEEHIKGNNPSLLEVRNKLKLSTSMEGMPLQISWDTNNFEILGSNGEINNEDLKESGAVVVLTATLIYQEYKDSYEIEVKVLPPILSESEKIKKQLAEQVKQADKQDKTNRYIELPINIDGKKVVWSEPKDTTKSKIWLLAVIAAIVIYFGKDKDLETKIKQRNQQLLSDYPDIVSKLTLLLGAGMTIKGAWQKVAFDYREKKLVDSKYYRYAYEEMLISYYEIMSGVSEATAYEEFGKRTKNQRYMKLSSLITQNLKKGSKGLSKILEQESLDAFEERKAYAKTAGEEAGTKLMFPMFLNLIIVLVIIMIPACMSFQM